MKAHYELYEHPAAEPLVRDGYDYPTTAEVMAGGQRRGSGMAPPAGFSHRVWPLDTRETLSLAAVVGPDTW